MADHDPFDDEELTETIEECREKLSIDENIFDNISLDELDTNESFKEFLVCINTKETLFDSNGFPQRESMKRFFDRVVPGSTYDVDSLVGKCTVQSGDMNEMAFNFFKCGYQAIQEEK